MMDRRTFQSFHPFARLNRLLEGIAPGGGRPIVLSLGEPQHRPPDFVADTLAEAAAGWGRYPPPRGTSDYGAAASGWLVRRFGLPEDAAAPGGMIGPGDSLAGTNPGRGFIRVALVHETAEVEAALQRLADIL